ncbi:RICIN domain-containing protein [Marinagarivorans cellulosilyticus]|uniref:Ricin B lectin domain-containing protein n=1 Tax=Marinagarivorans cellulosilyticus TaxID=2721545 RepID=A0AAN2BIH3_9GAMM|nr:RICIN domain-containing protein [Marinagarivorans cellulosilyticus]BCD95942.1 hypothetical protein MARGE09_P0141 [Marinagarivorans cellulosilyticus]
MKVYLAVAALLLVGCGQGDRGGVSLGDQRSSIVSSSSTSSSSSVESANFIVSSIGKCLNMDSLDYLDVSDEAKINSWDCAPKASNQRWFFSGEGEIRSTNGLCLGLGEAYLSGIEVIAKECSDADHQQWLYDEFTGAIKNIANEDYCLDIFANNLHLNGRVINIWPCTHGLNQRWTTADLKTIKIRSFTDERLFVNIQPSDSGRDLKVSSILEGWASALWVIEPSENSYRVRSLWKPDQFLHIQNGDLESGAIESGWSSARWLVVPQGEVGENAFLLRNVWKPDIYIGLNVDNYLVADEFSNLVDGSYIWISSED